MKERIIFHIDVNNAFLSWTAVYLLKNGFNKDIRKVPSIIGGDEHSRRGIVLAKSPVAKKYGIVTAEPIYQARKKCPILEIYPSNYSWYQEKSNELMTYLKNYSPDQEQLSVDECFLDMTGMKYIYDDLIELAYKIKDEIKTKFGYTVNIGIANNKLCAKMASDFEKPDRVHTLFNYEIKEKMWPLPVNDLYMCGKKTAEQLNKLNIKTIGDLANTNIKILEKYFKSYGKYLKEAANGIDNSKVEKRKSKNKSISTTTTLPHNYKDIDSLKRIILNQVEEITRELRDKKLYAKTVGVIFKNKDFISYSAQETFDKPTDNTKEILNKTYKVLEENYKEDEIRLIGVRLSNLTQEKQEQISLFEENKEEGEDILQKTMDKINNKFGKSLINPASFNNISEKKEQK
ncbi:MAG: DNA polymerase IV [Bacilli bacterium]|nr:DNA polymerase IV [Bacilli bacterium]